MNERTSTETNNAKQSEESERTDDHDEECGNPASKLHRVVLVESAEILELTREGVSETIVNMGKQRDLEKKKRDLEKKERDLKLPPPANQQSAGKSIRQEASADLRSAEARDREDIREDATDNYMEPHVRPGAVWVTGMDADNTTVFSETTPELQSMARPSDSSNGNANTQMETILPIPDAELHNEVLDAFPRASIRTEKEIDSERSSSCVNRRLMLLFSIFLLAALGSALAIVRSKSKDDESQANVWDQLVEATESLYTSSPFRDKASPQHQALEWIFARSSARAEVDPGFIPSESFDWIVTNYALYRLFQSTNESAIWETLNWFVDAPMLDYCNYDKSYSPAPNTVFAVEMMSQCDGEGNFIGLLKDKAELQGSIPNEIGLLTNLEFLSFRQNSLRGTIPKSLGALTNLRLFDIHFNALSGTLPSDLGNLTRVEEFRLLENPGLVGTIPTEFAQLTSLRRMSFSRTRLNGTVPEEFCDMVEERREETGDPSFFPVYVDGDQISLSCCCCGEEVDCTSPGSNPP